MKKDLWISSDSRLRSKNVFPIFESDMRLFVKRFFLVFLATIGFGHYVLGETAVISYLGPKEDITRPEVTMKLLGIPHNTPKKFHLPMHRTLAFQIVKPIDPRLIKRHSSVILFSGGWGEDFRLYSTILKNLASSGYLILNIDHYYYQNTAVHPPGYDDWVKATRMEVDTLNEAEKQSQFMKIKATALDVYTKDIFFTLDHLQELLINGTAIEPSAVVLMGHSLGGNADKKTLEELPQHEKWKNWIKAFISLDSRLNQLGLKTSFELPTLVLGAYTGYEKFDLLRQLPKQKNLTLKVLEHSTHVSFDDFSIFHSFGKDLTPLKEGMNPAAKQALEEDIQKLKSGPPIRFGEPLFLGTPDQMKVFLQQINQEIIQFLDLALK